MKARRKPAAARRKKRVSTPDTGMTPAEKESLIEQVEEFEGPDRREKRGSEGQREHEPGVARS